MMRYSALRIIKRFSGLTRICPFIWALCVYDVREKKASNALTRTG